MGQRGFTLVEVVVAVACMTLLLVAGSALLGRMHPGALRNAVDDFDADLAAARAIAAGSGNGATIAVLPRVDAQGKKMTGFVLRVYTGRPNGANTVQPSTTMAIESVATISERTLGTPPFTIFLNGAGYPSAIASYPQFDAQSHPSFSVLASQPPCPPGGIVLTFTSPQGATATRALQCAVSVSGNAAPNVSPTPNVPVVSPAQLVAHWTTDAQALRFVAAEFGYAHWFASSSGSACGRVATYDWDWPYTAPQNASESGLAPLPPNAPYSWPNNGGASMNDAPAPFKMSPVKNAPGTCVADIVDDYGQHAGAHVVVMGDLAASAASLTFTSPSSGAQTLLLSKTYDVEDMKLMWGGNCGALGSIAQTAHVTQPTLGATPSSATLTITPKGVSGNCSLTISDQYGEPPITIPITIDVRRVRTWPNAVKYAQSGGTFLADATDPHDAGAIFNALLGGATALASSPCKAQAFTDATFSTPDASPPANVVAQLATLGVTIGASGCFLTAGAPASNAPLTVWEPDNSIQTYTPQLGACGSMIFTGSWSPLSATASIASLKTGGGSGNGSCTISIQDGSGASLNIGNGLIAARIAAADLIVTYLSPTPGCVSKFGTWTCSAPFDITTSYTNCDATGTLKYSDSQPNPWPAQNGSIDVGPNPTSASAWTAMFNSIEATIASNARPAFVVGGVPDVSGCP